MHGQFEKRFRRLALEDEKQIHSVARLGAAKVGEKFVHAQIGIVVHEDAFAGKDRRLEAIR